jgi:hypothetical protein
MGDKEWERRGEEKLENLFWLFLLYSLLGFLLEVAFARLTRCGKQDRKCLYFLPLCPVYGLGALAILALSAWTGRRPLSLFLLGGLAATGVEYLYDLLCDRLLGVRFWDYSALPGNLRGRVCLPFSLCWGLLSWVVVWGIQPGMERLLPLLPGWLTLPAALLLGLDALFTVLVLRRSHRTDSLCWYRRIPPRRGRTA